MVTLEDYCNFEFSFGVVLSQKSSRCGRPLHYTLQDVVRIAPCHFRAPTRIQVLP